MKCLLWETSCVPWGVGLAEFDAQQSNLRHYTEDSGARTLAGNFIAAADRVLSQSANVLSDVGGIAASLGPGSWTGLRIGLTAAKTLALSLQIPFVGVPTFDVVAEALQRQFPDETDALLLVQAPCRPGERYAKLWRWKNGACQLLEAEWIDSPHEIIKRLEAVCDNDGPVHVITGSPHGEILELPATSLRVQAAKSTFEERMRALGTLAAQRFHASGADDALAVQPIYLAPSAAERDFYARQQAAATTG